MAGLWIPAISVAAAIGVVLYFVGALGAHVRAHTYAAASGFPLAIAFVLVGAAALASGLA